MLSRFFNCAIALYLLLSTTVSWAKLPDFRDLVKDTSPAVVNISTVQAPRVSNLHPRYGLPQDVPEIFRHFFGTPMPSPGGKPEKTSLGSGFIVSKDGYILTNNHVIRDADEIIVRLNDRRELIAQLIGADERSDLALLKVDAGDLPAVELGNSDRLDVGEWVVAIGSPFGFDYSVTAGIVSAKGRSLPNENYVPFIQTDVAINPGNSGGPLFNLDGEVVGINSQIYTRSGGFMGVSFAIPMNVAMEVADQLKENGRVDRGWLGVVIQEVSRDLAESFGLRQAAGALVAQIVTEGPADQAGLESGDIITHFNGRKIELSSDLPHQVGRVTPGDAATVDIVRNGQRKKLKITIGQLPENDRVALNTSKPQRQPSDNRLGVVVAELDERQRRDVGSGVIVNTVAPGPAAMAGVVTGDVITMISGESIRSLQDFDRVVDQLPAQRSVPMRIVRRGAAMFIPLKIAR